MKAGTGSRGAAGRGKRPPPQVRRRAAEAAKAKGCGGCAGDLAHCHDTWVVHADGHRECLGAGCTEGAEGHGLVIRCDELEPPCGCGRGRP